LHWVVSGQFGNGSLNNLIDRLGDMAFFAGVQSEKAGGCTAGGIAEIVASASVNSLLKDTCVPTVHEIRMVAVTSSISLRVYKGLAGVHCLATNPIETIRTPVHLHEDTRECDGKVGVTAGT
jgi:hypothetical protein